MASELIILMLWNRLSVTTCLFAHLHTVWTIEPLHTKNFLTNYIYLSKSTSWGILYARLPCWGGGSTLDRRGSNLSWRRGFFHTHKLQQPHTGDAIRSARWSFRERPG